MKKKAILEFPANRFTITLGEETAERKAAFGDDAENAVTVKAENLENGSCCEDTYYYEDVQFAEMAFNRITRIVSEEINLNIWDELEACDGFIE